MSFPSDAEANSATPSTNFGPAAFRYTSVSEAARLAAGTVAAGGSSRPHSELSRASFGPRLLR